MVARRHDDRRDCLARNDQRDRRLRFNIDAVLER